MLKVRTLSCCEVKGLVDMSDLGIAVFPHVWRASTQGHHLDLTPALFRRSHVGFSDFAHGENGSGNHSGRRRLGIRGPLRLFASHICWAFLHLQDSPFATVEGVNLGGHFQP